MKIALEYLEIEVNKPFSNIGLVDYQDRSIVIRTIIARSTGYVSLSAFDAGEYMEGKISPFNTLLQVIDGNAEVIIGGESNLLQVGQSIIVPANLRSTLKAVERFKILSVMIKSGYEDVTP